MKHNQTEISLNVCFLVALFTLKHKPAYQLLGHAGVLRYKSTQDFIRKARWQMRRLIDTKCFLADGRSGWLRVNERLQQYMQPRHTWLDTLTADKSTDVRVLFFNNPVGFEGTMNIFMVKKFERWSE